MRGNNKTETMQNLLVTRLHKDAPGFLKLLPTDYNNLLHLLRIAAEMNAVDLAPGESKHHRINVFYNQAREIIKDCEMFSEQTPEGCQLLEIFHNSDNVSPVMTVCSFALCEGSNPRCHG